MKTYTIFILSDDGTWEQPSFTVDNSDKMTDHEIRMEAELSFGGFISFGLQEDDDPGECVTHLSSKD